MLGKWGENHGITKLVGGSVMSNSQITQKATTKSGHVRKDSRLNYTLSKEYTKRFVGLPQLVWSSFTRLAGVSTPYPKCVYHGECCNQMLQVQVVFVLGLWGSDAFYVLELIVDLVRGLLTHIGLDSKVWKKYTSSSSWSMKKTSIIVVPLHIIVLVQG